MTIGIGYIEFTIYITLSLGDIHYFCHRKEIFINSEGHLVALGRKSIYINFQLAT